MSEGGLFEGERLFPPIRAGVCCSTMLPLKRSGSGQALLVDRNGGCWKARSNLRILQQYASRRMRISLAESPEAGAALCQRARFSRSESYLSEDCLPAALPKCSFQRPAWRRCRFTRSMTFVFRSFERTRALHDCVLAVSGS